MASFQFLCMYLCLVVALVVIIHIDVSLSLYFVAFSNLFKDDLCNLGPGMSRANDERVTKNVCCHRLLLIVSYFKLFPMNVTQWKSRKKDDDDDNKQQSCCNDNVYLCFTSFHFSFRRRCRRLCFPSTTTISIFCSVHSRTVENVEVKQWQQKSITVMSASALMPRRERVCEFGIICACVQWLSYGTLYSFIDTLSSWTCLPKRNALFLALPLDRLRHR